MTEYFQIRTNGELTLPAAISGAANLQEGDLLKAILEEDRSIRLAPISLAQRELADAIHVPYQRINDIVHGRRSVTPSTALRLAKFFNMSADFWMTLQMRWDNYQRS